MHGDRHRPDRRDGPGPKIAAAHLEWANDVAWVSAHWDDVLSDFSVLHRIHDEADVEELTPRQFFPKAFRLVHYQGATRDVSLAKRTTAAPEQVQPASAAATEVQPPAEPVHQDPTPDQIKAMRDAARRKRFPADRFGDVSFVSAEDIVREAGNRG